ncbi:MAG: Phosphoserine phosphatase 1 [Actinomycetota bacterium]
MASIAPQGRGEEEAELTMSADRAVVHLLRHGEVHNPEGVLYGRLPGYFLSDLGARMAQMAADAVAHRDIAVLRSSPLERALQTASPIAAAVGAQVEPEERVIESTNVFEGKRVSVGDGVLRQPRYWRHLWQPFKPSWGEPYAQVAARMRAAIRDAAIAARGREALIVSHQLPIWIARLDAEGRRYWHDPRRRQCALASLTSMTFEWNGSEPEFVGLEYTEPAAVLLGSASRIAGA